MIPQNKSFFCTTQASDWYHVAYLYNSEAYK